MERAVENYRAEQLRQQIALDKSVVVADLMNRWSGEIGTTEKGRVGFSTAFANADAEKLLQLILAESFKDRIECRERHHVT